MKKYYNEIEPMIRNTADEIESDNFGLINTADAILEMESKALTDEEMNYLFNLIDEESPEIIFKGAGNSYNWNSRLTNDINYETIEYNDTTYTILKVHNGRGDVRMGYTPEIILEGTIFELLEDTYFVGYLQIMGRGFEFYTTPFQEGLDVYDVENNDDVGEVYSIDVAGVKEEVWKLLGEI